jgi:hypothetical protein
VGRRQIKLLSIERSAAGRSTVDDGAISIRFDEEKHTSVNEEQPLDMTLGKVHIKSYTYPLKKKKPYIHTDYLS